MSEPPEHACARCGKVLKLAEGRYVCGERQFCVACWPGERLADITRLTRHEEDTLSGDRSTDGPAQGL